MMTNNPNRLTEEQKAIISEPSNCVVIAAPGSGKTFVLSEKIKLILDDLPNHQGVIAISFTNKASNELKKRTLSKGVQPKNSFFGTIDKFCVTEIILSFGKQIFGFPKKEFRVIDSRNLLIDNNDIIEVLNTIKNTNSDNLNEEQINALKFLFVEEGIILLAFLSITANYIIQNSISCQKYIQARYSHIIIDEYQDSDFEQDKLFLKLIQLNLKGIAVGDIRQAIFAFAGKKSKFLIELTQRENFSALPLTFNFRCHPSISNYSKILLQSVLSGFTPILQETNEIRVYEKKIIGDGIDILKWIDEKIPLLKEELSIINENKIGILVKSNKSGLMVDNNLKLPHRLINTNSLDTDVSQWSNLFTKLLYYGYDSNITAFEFMNDFFDIYESKQLVKKLIPFLENFQLQLNRFDCQDSDEVKNNLIISFVNIANHIHPDLDDDNSINLLKGVINSNDKLISYFPPKANEVQILTLFKAKGLEFDLVFHLDLYEHILPKRDYSDNSEYYENIEQDINLHYVGITRAKKSCFLVHSTRRQNSKGRTVNASPSEFLTLDILNELKNYRNII